MLERDICRPVRLVEVEASPEPRSGVIRLNFTDGCELDLSKNSGRRGSGLWPAE